MRRIGAVLLILGLVGLPTGAQMVLPSPNEGPLPSSAAARASASARDTMDDLADSGLPATNSHPHKASSWAAGQGATLAGVASMAPPDESSHRDAFDWYVTGSDTGGFSFELMADDRTDDDADETFYRVFRTEALASAPPAAPPVPAILPHEAVVEGSGAIGLYAAATDSRRIQRAEEDATPDAANAIDPQDLLPALVIMSQDSLALLGLAPQPGVASGPANPLAQLPHEIMPAVASRIQLASAEITSFQSPGWLMQAAWTVALSAFVVWAFAAAGTPLVAAKLFSRFARDDVLDHPRRVALWEAIRADPGAAFGALAERVALAPGVVQHHLQLLEQHDLVRRIRDGRTTRFYPAGPKIAPPAALAPRRSQILATLRDEPGLSAPELAARLGQRVQSTWDHLHRLQEAGLLAAERRGRAFAWHVAMPASS